MSYNPVSEKVPVAPMQMSRPANNQDYRQNGDIRRARRIVLILLAVELAFALFYFIERIVALARYYNVPLSIRDEKLAGTFIGNTVAAAISVVYILLFITVVVKYVRIGILIFAWLGLIQLICILVVIILAIIAVVAASAAAASVGTGVAISVVIIIVAAITCLLTILTVVFAFKLAKLLKMQEAYQFV